MNTAVVIAWRKGETDLAATIASAQESVGEGTIYAVEDKTHDGPARTRHRGIQAAEDADVIIIVDAHMRFDGSVLRDMAARVSEKGGLYCAKCYHNAECTFDSKHPSGASYYAGANIEYMGNDGNGNQALVWKWSPDPEPGPRPCIGGACYVFRRDWYYSVGQPLAALPGWGCDEEALSISAWMSGHMPAVYDGKVAHKWRARTPWMLTNAEAQAIKDSRAALVTAVVADPEDRAELLTWQGAAPYYTQEVERWRDALLTMPGTWADWKRKVAIMPKTRKPKAKARKKAVKRSPVPKVATTPIPGRANYGSAENRRVCKCGSPASTVRSERVTGHMRVRYRICLECGAKRTTQEIVG